MTRILFAALFATALACQNPFECPDGTSRQWAPAVVREDLRACNTARAGASQNGEGGGSRFRDCMYSMGYTEVCK